MEHWALQVRGCLESDDWRDSPLSIAWICLHACLLAWFVASFFFASSSACTFANISALLVCLPVDLPASLIACLDFSLLLSCHWTSMDEDADQRTFSKQKKCFAGLEDWCYHLITTSFSKFGYFSLRMITVACLRWTLDLLGTALPRLRRWPCFTKKLCQMPQLWQWLQPWRGWHWGCLKRTQGLVLEP